jgi:thiol-disulfide isomerase/thioredoxin
VAIILIGGGLWYQSGGNQHRPNTNKQQTQPEIGARVGDIAPTFALNGLDDKKVTVGGPGKLYVMNFWASWCPPCRAEFPELVRFFQKYQGKVSFYSINLQESKEKVDGFLKQNGYKLPVLLDQTGSVAQTFRVAAIPTTIVVDDKGIIRYRQSGAITLVELETIIKGLQVR